MLLVLVGTVVAAAVGEGVAEVDVLVDGLSFEQLIYFRELINKFILKLQ
jgi:hypothetical protein